MNGLRNAVSSSVVVPPPWTIATSHAARCSYKRGTYPRTSTPPEGTSILAGSMRGPHTSIIRTSSTRSWMCGYEAAHRRNRSAPTEVPPTEQTIRGCSHLLLVRVICRVEGKGVADEVIVAAGVLAAVGKQETEASVGDVLLLPDEEGEVLLSGLLAARAAHPGPVTLVGY